MWLCPLPLPHFALKADISDKINIALSYRKTKNKKWEKKSTMGVNALDKYKLWNILDPI